MNFDFLKECKMESPALQEMYESLSQKLEQAEWSYRSNPRESGMLLRDAAEDICRIYNAHYAVGFAEGTALEQFLCYTDDEAHNAMVSRFLSVVRKEQRDLLNKLRVLGDDCVLGQQANGRGMAFEDRMSQNVKRMMEAMMGATKDMCKKINKREDLYDEVFLEEALPEPVREEVTESGDETGKKSLFSRLFGR